MLTLALGCYLSTKATWPTMIILAVDAHVGVVHVDVQDQDDVYVMDAAAPDPAAVGLARVVVDRDNGRVRPCTMIC